MKRMSVAAAVLVLGVVLVAVFFMSSKNEDDLSVVVPSYESIESSPLFGTWKTRSVAENNNLNGAYSGVITFGQGFYEVQNDVVVTPIKIEGVTYRLDGNKIVVYAGENSSESTAITLLNETTATIEFPSVNKVTLFMYKQ